jgi:hypothetical protein
MPVPGLPEFAWMRWGIRLERFRPTVRRDRRKWSASSRVGRYRPGGGRASRRALREVMASLVNTVRRCHSTVRAPMKSSAPISAFDRPSRASRAMCSSCEVSPSDTGQAFDARWPAHAP